MSAVKDASGKYVDSVTGKPIRTALAWESTTDYEKRLGPWESAQADNADATKVLMDQVNTGQAPWKSVSTGYSSGSGKGTTKTPAAAPLSVTASKTPTSSVSPANNLYDQMPKSLSVSPAQQAGNEASETAFNDLMKQMSTVAGSQLKGEIPADVEAQVRMQAAEKGLFYGLGAGSPANRALTARDLGLTSMQIQQQGQQAGQALAGLAESRRQFNVQSEQAYKSYLEDVRRGDLSATELSMRSQQFNAQQRLAATEMMVNILDSYNKLSYSYSAIENPTAGQLATQQTSADSYEAAIRQIKADYGIGA